MKHDDEERRTRSAPTSLSGHVVLIVGPTPEVLRRATMLLGSRGIVARTTTLQHLRADAKQLKPLMLLVDANVYELDRPGLTTFVQETGIKLSVVSNVNELDSLLESVLSAANPSGLHRAVEHDTAKYDPKTLQDALDQMAGKRTEFETAKYDAKTILEAVALMEASDKPAE